MSQSDGSNLLINAENILYDWVQIKLLGSLTPLQLRLASLVNVTLPTNQAVTNVVPLVIIMVIPNMSTKYFSCDIYRDG